MGVYAVLCQIAQPCHLCLSQWPLCSKCPQLASDGSPPAQQVNASSLCQRLLYGKSMMQARLRGCSMAILPTTTKHNGS